PPSRLHKSRKHAYSPRHGPAARVRYPLSDWCGSRARVAPALDRDTNALAGGGAGLLLAMALTDALSHWRVPMDFPVQYDVNPDWRVFLFAVAGSLIAAGLFGSP